MSPTPVIIAALFILLIGVISGMAVTFAFQAHLRVRRELHAAQKALEAREAANPVLHAAINDPKGDWARARHREPRDLPKSDPYAMGAVGPTETYNREMARREREREDSAAGVTPRSLNPTVSDIREASQEATKSIN